MKKLIFQAALLSIALSPIANAEPLDSEQQAHVKQLVRETLLQNPDIIVEVIDELKRRDEAARNQAQHSALTNHNTELFKNSFDPYAGAENPTLSIVYFGDINCGYCKRQDPILESVVKNYPEVRIIYKDLPILGPSSREAAAIALASAKIGNSTYLSLHKNLMEHAGAHNTQSIANVVNTMGLNLEMLKASVDDQINQQLDNNIVLAHKLGITGTPALVFPDKVVGGFTHEDRLKEMIEERLN
ncbi:DsbA family protein [Endozoicomonas ascidiicola]|uniref:DsbA family protein n=1 Tax=Endozoicomonas ascidiicola TaxID=1698521 RepID=UPI0008326D8D|nr:DsbA family protein [Endozoicomonas ascidiicola]